MNARPVVVLRDLSSGWQAARLGEDRPECGSRRNAWADRAKRIGKVDPREGDRRRAAAVGRRAPGPWSETPGSPPRWRSRDSISPAEPAHLPGDDRPRKPPRGGVFVKPFPVPGAPRFRARVVSRSCAGSSPTGNGAQRRAAADGCRRPGSHHAACIASSRRAIDGPRAWSRRGPHGAFARDPEAQRPHRTDRRAEGSPPATSCRPCLCPPPWPRCRRSPSPRAGDRHRATAQDLCMRAGLPCHQRPAQPTWSHRLDAACNAACPVAVIRGRRCTCLGIGIPGLVAGCLLGKTLLCKTIRWHSSSQGLLMLPACMQPSSSGRVQRHNTFVASACGTRLQKRRPSQLQRIDATRLTLGQW